MKVLQAWLETRGPRQKTAHIAALAGKLDGGGTQPARIPIRARARVVDSNRQMARLLEAASNFAARPDQGGA